ncbi:hypothetical protein ACMXYW_10840 [Neptuniibacter sp. QD48_55]|uniref:hypothetical protein n=1 Tax=Neptuniibacter sp. QD48_55 TaxID=3398212 RepID=UPI0039F5A76E
MDEPYTQSIKAERKIRAVFLSDGEKVAISNTDKMIAEEMLDAYLYFKSEQRDYYANQEDIGDAVGVLRTAAANSIKKLEKIGLVESKLIEIKKGGARTSYQYKVKSWPELIPQVVTVKHKEPVRLSDLKAELSSS